MKTHHILFLAWFIVFIFWLARQFTRANKNYDKKSKG
jgi:hypothetical protein